MRNIVAIPLLALAVILQSTLVSQFSLLAGYADLILVMLAAWALQKEVTTGLQWAFLASIMISAVSHMPWYVTMMGYMAVVLFAILLQQRVWEAPLLAMFSVTFAGTVFMHLLSYLYLRFISGDPLPLGDSMGLITLPSLLLNLLIAIPMYGLMRDLASWVFPVKEEA
jgi:uncharacterized membrane protein (UPF0136 family)